MTLEQIGKLTPWQTRRIYFHARDKNGRVVMPAAVGAGGNANVLKAWWEAQQKQGASDQDIEKQWLDMLAGAVNDINAAVKKEDGNARDGSVSNLSNKKTAIP